MKDLSGIGRAARTAGVPAPSILERKFDAVVSLAPEERARLQTLQAAPEQIAPKTDILETGAHAHSTAVLLDGWAYRYKTLEDGRRQIIAFLVPGDFISLYSALVESHTTSVQTLTGVTVSTFKANEMLDLFQQHPRLAALICWSGAEADKILAEHIVSLGRRSAYQRIAHLFLELLIRLHNVGLTNGDTIEFPLTQEVIADTLGLSTVHVNRTLQRMRSEGHINEASDVLEIPRFDALAEIAQFDKDYLEHRKLPGSLLARLAG